MKIKFDHFLFVKTNKLGEIHKMFPVSPVFIFRYPFLDILRDCNVAYQDLNYRSTLLSTHSFKITMLDLTFHIEIQGKNDFRNSFFLQSILKKEVILWNYWQNKFANLISVFSINWIVYQGFALLVNCNKVSQFELNTRTAK